MNAPRDTRAERALWGAVLNRGIVDALWPKPGASRNVGVGVDPLSQSRARAWLGTRDFAEVCTLAGFAPEFVASRVIPLVDGPEDVCMRFAGSLTGDPMGKRGTARRTRK